MLQYTSTLLGALDADDTAAMRSAFEAVGIQVHVDDDRWGDHRL